jgi:hypothetical protein
MSPIASIPGAFQSATNAIHTSLRRLEKDASVVANSTAVDSRETVAALVDSRQQVLYTQAAARVIRATDLMTKSLLDIHA